MHSLQSICTFKSSTTDLDVACSESHDSRQVGESDGGGSKRRCCAPHSAWTRTQLQHPPAAHQIRLSCITQWNRLRTGEAYTAELGKVGERSDDQISWIGSRR